VPWFFSFLFSTESQHSSHLQSLACTFYRPSMTLFFHLSSSTLAADNRVRVSSPFLTFLHLFLHSTHDFHHLYVATLKSRTPTSPRFNTLLYALSRTAYLYTPIPLTQLALSRSLLHRLYSLDSNECS